MGRRRTNKQVKEIVMTLTKNILIACHQLILNHATTKNHPLSNANWNIQMFSCFVTMNTISLNSFVPHKKLFSD